MTVALLLASTILYISSLLSFALWVMSKSASYTGLYNATLLFFIGFILGRIAKRL